MVDTVSILRGIKERCGPRVVRWPAWDSPRLVAAAAAPVLHPTGEGARGADYFHHPGAYAGGGGIRSDDPWLTRLAPPREGETAAPRTRNPRPSRAKIRPPPPRPSLMRWPLLCGGGGARAQIRDAPPGDDIGPGAGGGGEPVEEVHHTLVFKLSPSLSLFLSLPLYLKRIYLERERDLFPWLPSSQVHYTAVPAGQGHRPHGRGLRQRARAARLQA